MKNWEFTDIHSHIIPGVDDGSENMEISMRLIEEAYEDGIRTMIATPHFGIINPDYNPKKVKDNFAALCEKVSEVHPDMKLYLGNELFLAPGYADGLEDKMSNTMAKTKYVLIEFPDSASFDLIYHQVRRLLVAGYTPIFAHAERYMGAYKDVKGLRELKNQGIMIQVNSNSIASLAEEEKGLFKRKDPFKKLVREMLEEGLVDFVATDIHDLPGRKPHMTQAKDVMIDIIGQEETERILIDNPKWIIKG